ncbi:MAG: histidine--tRNA ligase [Ignavibacteriae bacterium]|nr:histidine--tRNA ligase [Ignavibacteriota bacterium]
MHISRPKGTIDFLPEDASKRRHIEELLRNAALLFNYSEIRTPAFEKTELFRRGIGENTDIVSKEMYSFSNNEFTLKPEMTAPVIRAYIENSLYNIAPVQKLYYIANMFRHERPQAGRFREFSQFGAEAIGSGDFRIDVELISFCNFFLNSFGINNFKILLNNIGSLSERRLFLEDLKDFLKGHETALSDDSRRRLVINPLRILDSKDPADIKILETAPVIFNYLNDDNKKHLGDVMNGLTRLGIVFEVDYRLVRGLDYYTSTTFEIVSSELGAQNAILGGGRYDMLIEQLGGKPAPAIGFACGLERLSMILEKNSYQYPAERKIDLYIVTSGDIAREKSLDILYSLRSKGILCETDYLNRSVKAQMKEANKLGVSYAVVIGSQEIETGTLRIKQMETGKEEIITFDGIINYKYV